jgi:uncharacterized membrane protein
MAIAKAMVVVLSAKVFVGILLEYRRYFPADFEAAFLIGRRESFHGLYAAAFYTHLLAGPCSLLLGALLMSSGARCRYVRLHRWAGRVQAAIIYAALVPSSLVMATQALTGAAAGWGFALLALATAYCMAAAIVFAQQRQFAIHQRWATRTFVLLVSPLLFRLVSGALIVLERESAVAYSVNAWLSWLVPLIGYELWWRWRTSADNARPSTPVSVPVARPSDTPLQATTS